MQEKSNGRKNHRKDFTFEENEGELTITSYIGNESDVTIPSTHKGMKIVAIGEGAFANNKHIESVGFSKSNVKTIGARAFEGCTNLKSIKFPAPLREIGDAAFKQSGVEHVVIKYHVTTIGDDCFAYCGNLRTANFDSFRGSIGERCFFMCMSLCKVSNLGLHIEEIGTNAFSVGRRVPNDPLWDVKWYNARIRLI